MLGAALTEIKDSVLYVDLLTSSDLELLKARKSGGVSGINKVNAQVSVSNKRYVILTYSGKVAREKRIENNKNNLSGKSALSEE